RRARRLLAVGSLGPPARRLSCRPGVLDNVGPLCQALAEPGQAGCLGPDEREVTWVRRAFVVLSTAALFVVVWASAAVAQTDYPPSGRGSGPGASCAAPDGLVQHAVPRAHRDRRPRRRARPDPRRASPPGGRARVHLIDLRTARISGRGARARATPRGGGARRPGVYARSRTRR